MRFTKVTAISMIILMMAAQSFDAAARVGGGRASSMSSSRSSYSAPASAPQRAGNGGNAGMQRPDVMNKVRDGQPQPAAVPAAASPSAAPVGATATVPNQAAKPGFGVGSLVGAAAAGAAVGYIANSAMHDGNSNQNAGATGSYSDPLDAGKHADSSGSPGFPWGFILMLLAGTAAIVWVLRYLSMRREAADMGSAPMQRNASVPVASGVTGKSSEQQEFERNALQFFNELQEANNRGDVAYMEEHAVGDMKQQLIDDIRNRASASKTRTMMMDAQRVDLTEEAERSLASVRFRGSVSEDENSAPEQIDEVWHFVRGKGANSQWQLIGIEQV